jgi:ATP-binding cassette, subfamily B, bacterial PglK
MLQVFTRLYYQLTPFHRRRLGVIAVLVILSGVAEMLSLAMIMPFLSSLGNAGQILRHPKFSSIADYLHIRTPLHLISVMAFLFGLTVIMSSLLRLVSVRGQFRLSASIGSDLSCRIYSSTLFRPYIFHTKNNTSNLIANITHDVDEISRYLLPAIFLFISNSFLVLIISSVLLLIDPIAALSSAFVLGLSYSLIIKFTRSTLSRNSSQVSILGRTLVKYIQEGLGGIRDVLLDGSQDFFESQYRLADIPYRQSMLSSAFIAVVPRFFIESLAMCSIALLSVWMAYRSESFDRVIPVLGALALGANRLLPSLQACFASLTTFQSTIDSLKNVLNVLENPASKVVLADANSNISLTKSISFDNVWFQYDATSPWILQDLSFTIQANTAIGFVGSTGSGKSTTADLLLGLLQPQRGRILIDGIPLTEDTLSAWQKNVAHVPQNIFLTDGTIAENIAFAVAPDRIDMERVYRAAQMAQLSNFVEAMPLQYDEIVGERGVRLSGGQRQRIGIARALYRQASVIVLDEATSALDNATEREVMEAIDGLSKYLTVILIAHRLSTVQNCDMIFEMDQGCIINSGKFDELIVSSASFQDLSTSQKFFSSM